MEFLYVLESLRTPILDAFFQLITYLGQETFVVVLICWLYWCSHKELAYTLGFTYFVSGLLVQGLKITFRVPRPWVLDPDFTVVPSAQPDATGYSFPSGHTQSGTALFFTLSLAAPRKWQKGLCVLAFLLIGFSRMYLGCHTPQDVLTAMAISLLAGWVIWKYLSPSRIQPGREGRVAAVFALISLALAAYALVLYQSGAIELHYAQDCCKASGAGLAFAIGYYIERTRLSFAPPAALSGKLLRLAIGLAVTLGLQSGLKPLIGESLPASFLRYFLVIFWVVALYPALFVRFSKNPKHSGQPRRPRDTPAGSL